MGWKSLSSSHHVLLYNKVLAWRLIHLCLSLSEPMCLQIQKGHGWPTSLLTGQVFHYVCTPPEEDMLTIEGPWVPDYLLCQERSVLNFCLWEVQPSQCFDFDLQPLVGGGSKKISKLTAQPAPPIFRGWVIDKSFSDGWVGRILTALLQFGLTMIHLLPV